MPLRSWYLSGTKKFHSTILVGWKWQSKLGWVIKSALHNLVQMIRIWRMKSSQQDSKYWYWTISKTLFWNLFTSQWTYMIDWVGRMYGCVCIFIHMYVFLCLWLCQCLCMSVCVLSVSVSVSVPVQFYMSVFVRACVCDPYRCWRRNSNSIGAGGYRYRQFFWIMRIYIYVCVNFFF